MAVETEIAAPEAVGPDGLFDASSIDARSEVISMGGGWPSADKVAQILSQTADSVTEYEGEDIWRRMDADPTIYSSVRTLKLAILGEGIRITPAVEADPEGPPPADGSEPAPPTPEQSQASADAQQAAEIAAFVKRVLDGMRTPVDSMIYQLLDAASEGCKLAELVWRVAETGEDAGRLVLDRVKVKPNSAWRFVVDGARNVLGYRPTRAGIAVPAPGDAPTQAEQIRPRVVAPEKCIVLAWCPQDDDPRGNSAKAPCYRPYAVKVQVWIEYVKYLAMFATPIVIAMAPPNGVGAGMGYRVERDSAGNPIPDSAPVSITTDMANTLANLRNASVAVLPGGSNVEVVIPEGEGQAHLNALDMCDRQSTLAILGATRMTQEAQSGSKADSETATDVFGLVVRFGQALLSRAIEWGLIDPIVRYNLGDDAADRLAPTVSFGKADIGDLAALWNAFANLVKTDALDESQMPEMYARLDLPECDMAGRAARLAQKRKLAAALAEATKAPADGSGAGDGEGNSDGAGDGSGAAA